MDSLKIFKGYGKVEDKHDHHHLEDQQQQQHRHRSKTSKFLIATTSIITILFLTLTLAFALATLLHHTTNTESQKPLNSAESIRAVCNVTDFPDSCFAAVSSSAGKNPTTDPESILRLSLRASTDELSKLASSLGAVVSNNPKGHALLDCKEQIDDALSRLNDSLIAMSAVPDGPVTLTDAKVNDIQTWVSAAVTDQQTCIDGLEEVESVAVTKVKSMMKKSSEYVSNSLAIVANLRTLLHQFHTPLH